MLFNSLAFLIFAPTIFLLYWFVANRKVKIQNFFLIVASYIFYGWWDWRFLSLIVFSSLIDYLSGINIEKSQEKRRKKLFLLLSIFVNLGFLGFFKYFNFFTDSFIDAFASLGIHLKARSLNIILPVGISFYTFQTLSYTIDVYKGKMKPTRDIIAFFAFVSFFPQLVAGPIERATHFLPQFYRKRVFDNELASDGMRQMLWGFFKKIVIADNLAIIVEQCFNNPGNMSSPDLVLGLIAFAFQIYCDFSGYSDIAIGLSRLFGFNLMRNFAYPYFSRDIAEFWRRWHISLSTWFRDYVYIPLGGSRGTKAKIIRNTIIIFVVSGFWHGANWTFIAWGALNALFFLPLILSKRNRRNLDIVACNRKLPSFREFAGILSTFVLCLIAWTFFRAESISSAVDYLHCIVVSNSQASVLLKKFSIVWIFLLLFVFAEWLQRDKKHALHVEKLNVYVRWLIYSLILISIIYFGQYERDSQFIYFQF